MAENSTDQQEKQANPIDENQDFVPKLTGKQKAALVVVSLGSDRASQIYKYLGEHDIEELTFEVAKMGKTPTLWWRQPWISSTVFVLPIR